MRSTHAMLIGLPLAAHAAAAPAAAAPGTVLDYRRDEAARAPVVSPREREALAEAVGESLRTKSWVVLGRARGAFSVAKASEDLYLVADRAPVAAEPFPDGPGQLLVAIGPGGASVYRLPAAMRYQRIAGTVDADRDGRGEVLLESAFYNMGQSVTSVDLVGLGSGGETTLRQSLQAVASDSCDNRGGKRERRASTIALGDDGRLVAQSHALGCP